MLLTAPPGYALRLAGALDADAFAADMQAAEQLAGADPSRAVGGENERNYSAAAQMLRALGADRIRLLRNNPDKAAQLDLLGGTPAERVPPASTSRGATPAVWPRSATTPRTSSPSRGPEHPYPLRSPDDHVYVHLRPHPPLRRMPRHGADDRRRRQRDRRGHEPS